eukprot:scaffold602986_cov55-Prasinocladus_malaysianus.AAC.1
MSGRSNLTSSGDVTVGTADAGFYGVSGQLRGNTGESAEGNSGSISLSTGAAVNGSGGDISLA